MPFLGHLVSSICSKVVIRGIIYLTLYVFSIHLDINFEILIIVYWKIIIIIKSIKPVLGSYIRKIANRIKRDA